MWPKTLLELLPHIVRLVPAADRYFSSKSSSEEANRKAMEAMAEGLKGDLGQVTASHAGLYRQLNDQSEKLATIAAETHAAKAAAEFTEARIVFLEQRLTLNAKILFGTFILNVIMLVLLVILFVRH